MLPIGSRLSHYRLEALLGEGGMGQVYSAFDEKLHRRVALKVLLADDAAAAKAMVREARAAAALEHPNKVSVFELGEVDGRPFLAMELISGPTLRKMVGDRSVAWQDMVAWLLDVARALDAAHAAGLVHRDVKPDNVMLRDDGVVKVLDFGIARRSAAVIDPSAPTLVPGLPTATGGVIVGTVAYMAPEQLRGEELDGRCDEFAWGVMAFEMLTGEHPWGLGRDALGLLSVMLTRAPRALSEARPELPAKLSDAVARTLAPDRERRFAAMRDVVAELAPLVGQSARGSGRLGEVASAPAKTASAPATDASSGVTIRGTPRARSKRWAIALAGVAILALGAVAFERRKPRPSPAEHAGSAAASLPPAAASPRHSPVFPCADTQKELPPAIEERACSNDAVAWCAPSGRVTACCGKNLVPVGDEGACGCPKVEAVDPSRRNPTCPPAPVQDFSGETVRRVVRERFGELRGCYERVLVKSPGTAGKLSVWFEIDPEGDVYYARIKETSFSDADAQRCMLDVFRALRFGPIASRTTILYPIEFAPGE